MELYEKPAVSYASGMMRRHDMARPLMSGYQRSVPEIFQIKFSEYGNFNIDIYLCKMSFLSA